MDVKRINVTLDEDVYNQLDRWAKSEDRTVPNLLAYLGRKALEEKKPEVKAGSTRKK